MTIFYLACLWSCAIVFCQLAEFLRFPLVGLPRLFGKSLLEEVADSLISTTLDSVNVDDTYSMLMILGTR